MQQVDGDHLDVGKLSQDWAQRHKAGLHFERAPSTRNRVLVSVCNEVGEQIVCIDFASSNLAGKRSRAGMEGAEKVSV